MVNLINSRLLCIGLCLLLVVLTGCSTLGARARRAAVTAVSDPWVWGSLAGAAVVVATNNDERVSQWAKTNTPVYGSPEAAAEASDRYRRYASTSTWAIFLTASPQATGNWFMEKGMDVGGNMAGLALARSTTGVLKGATARERPNGSPVRDSFPSAHATDAFAHASLVRDYSRELPIYRPLRQGMQWVTNSLALATAWGRVEGGYHYPSDVLMGAAVANFTTHFFKRLDTSSARSDWRVRPRTNENGKLLIEFTKPL